MALVLLLEQVGSRLVPVAAAQLPPGAQLAVAAASIGGGSSRRAAVLCCAGAAAPGPRHRGGWSTAAMEVALGGLVVARAGGEGMGVPGPGDEALKGFVHDFKENFRPMTIKEVKDAGLKFSEDKYLVEKVQMVANNGIDLVTETDRNKDGYYYWASTLDIIKAEILLRQVLQEAEEGGYIREDVLVDAITATSAAGQLLRPIPSYDNPTGAAVYQYQEYETWVSQKCALFDNVVADLAAVLAAMSDKK